MEKAKSVGQGLIEGLDGGLVIASSLMGAYFLVFFALETIPSDSAGLWCSVAALAIGVAVGLTSFVGIAGKMTQRSAVREAWAPPLFWATAIGQALCAVALFALPEPLRTAAWCLTWFFIAWSFACIGCRFSALPLRRRIIATVFSTAGACAVALVLVGFGAPSAFAVISILPLGAIACLARGPFSAAQEGVSAEDEQRPRYFEGGKAKFSPAFLAAALFLQRQLGNGGGLYGQASMGHGGRRIGLCYWCPWGVDSAEIKKGVHPRCKFSLSARPYGPCFGLLGPGGRNPLG